MLRSTDTRMVQRGDDRRPQVHPYKAYERNRDTVGKEEGKQVEGETPYCANCVMLVYLDGILRCAEFKKLLSAEDIRDPIDCDKFTPLSSLKNMKSFRG